MTFSIAPVPIVVDASVLVEAAVGNPVVALAVEDWVVTDRFLLSPPIMWPEVGNALHMRHRIPAVDVASLISAIESTGLETADRGPEGIRSALVLAERHALSVYDATYLWLAIDVDGELATLDAHLSRAAEAEGVPLAIPT
jgi:predicted nucleic acid-binding protein